MLDIDTAIKHCLEVAEQNEKKAEYRPRMDYYDETESRTDCLECAAEHRQLAEWLNELKEAKRLLKAAVEDLSCGGENNKCTKSCKTCTYNSIKGYGCRYFGEYHWRYEAEALALIGKDIDVPASADDTNVGHKSGGWISCKDYMPDTLERALSTMYSDCCLVCDAFGWVGMAYYITDGQKSWWEFADAQNKNKIDWTEVTHWHPLPEPPKDGDT